MAHHQEADCVQAELSGERKMLRRDVCLCAVSGDTDHADPSIGSPLDVLPRTDPGQQQARDGRPLRVLYCCVDQAEFVFEREPVVE